MFCCFRTDDYCLQRMFRAKGILSYIYFILISLNQVKYSAIFSKKHKNSTFSKYTDFT